MNMRVLAVVATALAWSGVAHAEVGSFAFETVGGNLFEATGLVYTADSFNAVGAANVLALTGTVVGRGGGAITGLVINPNQPYPQMYFGGSYDNDAFPTTPLVDSSGVLFEAAGYFYRIYSEGGEYWLTSNNPYVLNLGTKDTTGEPAILGTLLVSPGLPSQLPPTVTLSVPEPSTWGMMILGFAGLAAFGRVRRFGRSAAA
jgi:hypothetical protein